MTDKEKHAKLGSHAFARTIQLRRFVFSYTFDVEVNVLVIDCPFIVPELRLNG